MGFFRRGPEKRPIFSHIVCVATPASRRVRPTSCSEGRGISERRFQTGRVQLLLCLCAGLYRIAFSSAPHQGLDLVFTLTENCLARQSVECHRCQDSCEPMAITFRPTLSGIYQPQLDSQACNGCGACVAICPVSAIKAENHHAH